MLPLLVSVSASFWKMFKFLFFMNLGRFLPYVTLFFFVFYSGSIFLIFSCLFCSNWASRLNSRIPTSPVSQLSAFVQALTFLKLFWLREDPTTLTLRCFFQNSNYNWHSTRNSKKRTNILMVSLCNFGNFFTLNSNDFSPLSFGTTQTIHFLSIVNNCYFY